MLRAVGQRDFSAQELDRPPVDERTALCMHVRFRHAQSRRQPSRPEDARDGRWTSGHVAISPGRLRRPKQTRERVPGRHQPHSVRRQLQLLPRAGTQ